MKVLLKNKIRAILITLTGIAFITASGGGGDSGTDKSKPLTSPGVMQAFSDYPEIERYIKEQYAANVVAMRSAYPGDMPADDTGGDSGPEPTSEPGPEHSGTNVQETDVDEADKVKTDGTYFYIAGDNAVNVIKGYPSNDMQIISKIDISGNVDSIYLYNDLLIVLHRVYDYSGWPEIFDMFGPEDAVAGCFAYVSIKTGVTFINVTDPSNPEEIKDVMIEGHLISTRITNDKLFMVVKYLPNLPELQLVYNPDTESGEEIINKNREAMAPVSMDVLLPNYEIYKNGILTEKNSVIFEPGNLYHPTEPDGGLIVSILSFDLKNPENNFNSTGIVANAHDIYANVKSLYLINSDYDYFYEQDRTIIHKFDITADQVTSVGGGIVKGQILNQFSLSEFEDVLRIATTTDKWNRDITSNHIFCLKIVDSQLTEIGKIEDIARGESIYAARFIGTKGFLVTFVKVDPLFTLDLSNPEIPVIAGELKVPGYSEYIHPLNENFLLTIGRDAEEINGNMYYQEIQLSIFDISDFSNPQLKFLEKIGDRYTGSEALYNHKAFTYWSEKQLLSIPVTDYPDAGTYFCGNYIYRISTETGFELIKQINIAGVVDHFNSSYWTRGVFIENDAYTIKSGIIASKTTDTPDDTMRYIVIP